LVNSGLITCAANGAQYYGYKYALIYWQVKINADECRANASKLGGGNRVNTFQIFNFQNTNN